MPHCFNAWDAVDPDKPYYQGPGWYRTTFTLDNPYPNGRTLLHFEGAGQRSEVYVGLEFAGRHLGGYDEFTIDITDAATRSLKRPDANGQVQLAVLCDNSRSLETIPSDQSDFNRYGGLYRSVNLHRSLRRHHPGAQPPPRGVGTRHRPESPRLANRTPP